MTRIGSLRLLWLIALLCGMSVASAVDYVSVSETSAILFDAHRSKQKNCSW